MRSSGLLGAILPTLKSQTNAIARSYEHFIRSRSGSARKVARLLLPPIVVRILSNMGGAEWEYVADHWPKNDCRSVGWDDSSVVRTMLDNWEAYSQVVEGTEPLALSPWFARMPDFKAHNVLMTYGYVLGRAAANQQSLSVLDWGGALGHYAAVGHALMPEVALNFTVKERPDLCAAGCALLPKVTFTSSEEGCFSRGYDLVMANNSLQYAEDWQLVTRRLADAAKSWLFIMSLPLVRKAGSFVVVQRPQRHGLKADYISWVLNYDEFVNYVRRFGFSLEREFLSFGTDLQYYKKAPEPSHILGFLFRREATLAP
jgi:putative methyltransferase (TIGR04325 family)